MGDQPFQLVLGAVRSKVSYLRLEGDDQIGSGINNGGAKVINPPCIALQMIREPGRVRVESDAQQRPITQLGST
jgi:hypothetical protein